MDLCFLVVCITSVLMAFGDILASLYSSLYIIPQGRALERQSPADRSKESSHKFARKDPIDSRFRLD